MRERGGRRVKSQSYVSTESRGWGDVTMSQGMQATLEAGKDKELILP